MSNDIAIQSLKEKIDQLNQQAWDARVSGPSSVFELTQESLKLSRGINYTKGIAEATRSLGFYYARLAKNDEAQPLLQESLSLFESLNDLRGQAVVYEYLAIVQRSWGNLGVSLELLFKALELSQKTGFKVNEAFNHYQIGVTYKHLGNFEKALDHLYKSLSTHRETNNKLYQSYPINIIGSIYFENGDYTKALEYYKEGLISRQESNDKLGEAGSLDNIGFTYLKLKDYSQAIEYCTKSLSINETTGDKRGQGNAVLHLAEAYKQTGDIEKAKNFSNDSLEIKKATGDKKGEAELLLFLADLHKTQPENDKNILEWLNNSLKIAEEIKALDLLSKTRFHLYEYYKQKGDFEEALKNLDLHTNLEKEFHKNAINQKVSNLEISHKAEAISQRNKELTELNEQIEKANVELKIEASLERVRAIAMGMKEPADMINVCRMISDQLRQLEFKEIRNVQTVIIYPQKHEYLNYQYFTPYDKDSIETIDYRLHPDVLEFTNQMLASPDAYFTKTFEGEELRVWREYRKQTNQLHDPKLDEATSSHYYFYSIGSGALGVTTYAPLSDEQIVLFKRFRNVFALAYRRFIDIEKALAQAREAQIETALERVRSKTMAMHKSEEVTDVAVSLNEELLKLGFEGGSTIIIINKQTGDTEQWTGFSEDKSLKSCYVPYFKHPCHDAVLDAWKKDEKFLAYTVAGDEKRSLDEHYFSTGYKMFPESDKKWMREMPSVTFSHAFMKYGAIHWGPGHLTDEQSRILQRFSKVFEQSYTRFLDLQKAEGQAKEAQIQLALERVRASTMAMHKSDELPASANLLFHQVHTLGVPAFAAGYCIWEDDKQVITLWMSSEGVLQPPFKAPTTEDELFIQMRKGYEDGKSLHVVEMGGEELRAHYQYMRTLPVVGDIFNSIQEAGHPLPAFQVMHYAYFSKGFLLIITYEPVPDVHDIFKRFAKVFEQTYTRFLDLQKAEAQAREATIEAALERTRTQSMIMQHSKELDDTLRVFHQQVLLLGINSAFSFLWLPDEKNDRHIFWAAWGEEKNSSTVFKSKAINYPLDRNEPATAQCLVDWKSNEPVYSYHVPPAAVENYFAVWQELIDGVEHLKPEYFSGGLHYVEAFMKYGCFGVMVATDLREDEKKILSRFAIEFERTYTRFLDLQKAEAQAREAEIQLALERVRARSLAMHHTSELQDIVNIVAQQLYHIGMDINGGVLITINDEVDEDLPLWASSGAADYVQKVVVPFFNRPIFTDLRDAIKRRNNFFANEYGKEEKDEMFDHLFRYAPWSSSPEERKKELLSRKGGLTRSAAISQYTSIAITNHNGKKFSEDEHEILKRFGNVFEQSYTRFLDLQKAEAQAREADIELALERVRSRAMAMHSSQELKDVATELRNQMNALGQTDMEICAIHLYDESPDYFESIAAGPVFDPMLKAILVQVQVKLPKQGIQIIEEMMNQYHSGKKDYVLVNHGKKGVEWFELLKEKVPLAYEFVIQNLKETSLEDLIYYWSISDFKGGSLVMTTYVAPTDEVRKILRRFANVFGLAYQRFKDLKKAEAQTREAQIEAVLERVRSRSIGMQKSEELKEVIRVVYEQFVHLNIHVEHAGFIMDYKERDDMLIWLADKHEVPFRVTIPYFDSQHWNSFIEAKEKGKDFFANQLSFEEKNRFYQDLFKLFTVPDATKEYYFNCPGLAISTVLLDNVGLYIENFSGIPYTNEENNTLMRFGKVFQQTYTRFLDLQKAEAQTREAQIEVAVERVRAKALAMHRSEDLHSAVVTLKKELMGLQIPDITAATIYLAQDDGSIRVLDLSDTGGDDDDKPQLKLDIVFRLEDTDPDLWIRRMWDRSENYFVLEADEDDFVRVVQFIKTVDPAGGDMAEKIIREKSIKKAWLPTVKLEKGVMNIDLLAPPAREIENILLKMGAGFDLAYKRFLDLQKAEAQTKEAQTEVALERIRARAMAMHSSNELMEVAHILREQMGLLDQPDLETSVVNLFDEDSDYIHSWHAFREPGSSSGKTINGTVSFRKDSSELTKEMIGHYHSGKKEYTLEATGEKLIKFIQVLINSQPEISNYIGKNPPEKVYYHFATFTGGALLTVSYQPATEDIKSLQRRAASVFDMAYRRYLDLKKAEAQTREAQIEIAVERVRAKALAMHKSEEILSVVVVLRNELLSLNIPGVSGTTIYLRQDDGRIRMWDLTSVIELEDGFHLSMDIVFPLEETHPELFIRKIWNATEKYSIQIQNRNDLMRTVEWLAQYKKEEAENVKRFIETTDLKNLFHATVPLANGKLSVDLMEPPPVEMESILQKMANAFDLAYKRFLDLLKAEAQAREAQIEAALERVRGRSMAMHRSDELREVVAVLLAQLQQLGFDIKFCSIALIDKINSTVEFWLSGFSQEILPESYHVPNLDHAFYQNFQNTFRQGIPYKIFELTGEEKKSYDKLWFSLTDFKNLPESVKRPMIEMERVILSCAFTKNGMIQIGGLEALSDSDASIVQRFAKVFEQTHTRFLDLQKAEAQAREAQVEAALEKIRSRSLAMHKSIELKDVIAITFEKLKELNVLPGTVGIQLFDQQSMNSVAWIGTTIQDPQMVNLPYNEQMMVDENFLSDSWQAMMNGADIINKEYSYEQKNKYFNHLFAHNDLTQIPQQARDFLRQMQRHIICVFTEKNSAFFVDSWDGQFFSNESIRIIRRAAKVFEQAYIRFLDLQKAEAQARDAQIEASLEKVRAKVMTMKNSNDLNETSFVFGEQLRKLGIDWQFSYFWLIEEDKDDNTFWITWPDSKTSTTTYSLAEADENFKECIIAWRKQEKIHGTHVPLEHVQAWLDAFERITNDAGGVAVEIMKAENFKDGVYYYDAMIKFGSFGILMNRATNDEEKNIQARFATEFGRAYTRFLDLKKAEAQTREATIEVALERVRARALAMQEPEELKEVAQVLRTEMGLLGIEELETCSIYIHEKESDIAECWYALKDTKDANKKMVADHFHLDLNDTWVGREMKKFYDSEEKLTSVLMHGANRKEWIDYCYKHSPVFSGFYGETIPDRTYHLYKFSHGYLGAAAPDDISAESWKLLGRAASVFSLAYSRFKDLTQARTDLIKLKDEKKRAEDALTELQNTQKQLIQSEKMASLGELTAGIAHEIQNPLNFVNNFSDVSNELLAEMKSELATGNTQSAIEIAKDVKENLEKILHHGKRADAIVKGMLQHSRTSSGQKELTDINTLADEYLRLAYHGLRAKDKFFNAKFETDLDPSINKINVVPQEIGRVILNLINNSFYAVSERKKNASNGYEPKVTVSTRAVNPPLGGLGVVEIRVKDNGNGIPKKVLDKIFQPFFTTKPTGQGTGLGLSLSYDIIKKGHDGEINVNTKEGEGSEFIISLPVK